MEWPSKQERERRESICRRCEYSKVKEGSSKERCGKCGCVLSGRILIGCPDKRF
jgi:hypothetical protein